MLFYDVHVMSGILWAKNPWSLKGSVHKWTDYLVGLQANQGEAQPLFITSEVFFKGKLIFHFLFTLLVQLSYLNVYIS